MNRGEELAIVGVRFIEDTINSMKPFPDSSELPVFSRAFEGINVSTTGFNSEDRVFTF
jgi:hypothetical protein